MSGDKKPRTREGRHPRSGDLTDAQRKALRAAKIPEGRAAPEDLMKPGGRKPAGALKITDIAPDFDAPEDFDATEDDELNAIADARKQDRVVDVDPEDL